MNAYERESIDEDLVLSDREKAAAELRRLRQQNKLLGQSAREANQRLILAQDELERLRALVAENDRLRAALQRARDVLDEETIIELNWKEAGRVGNMLRAALAAQPPADADPPATL